LELVRRLLKVIWGLHNRHLLGRGDLVYQGDVLLINLLVLLRVEVLLVLLRVEVLLVLLRVEVLLVLLRVEVLLVLLRVEVLLVLLLLEVLLILDRPCHIKRHLFLYRLLVVLWFQLVLKGICWDMVERNRLLAGNV